MNIEQLKEEIKSDEGCVYAIYLDHLGKKTFGVGHLVTENDPEYLLQVGDVIDDDRVDSCFATDIEITVDECLALYDDFFDLPEEVQLIIANMMFNLGRTNLSKFKDMRRAVDQGDWNAAADAMIDSRWYMQVTNRAQRLVDRMRQVGE